MEHYSKILITGSNGMLGRALTDTLKKNDHHLLTPLRAELDLCNQQQVIDYFYAHKPDYIFHLAARVGGIYANQHYAAEFIYQNTAMQCHVIHAAHLIKAKKLLFPGSACTYPKLAPQPISEEALFSGYIEPTNLPYAVAKLNGIIMCQSYRKQYQLNTIVPMPTNAYGINDNFSQEGSHVIPALMMRFHEAKINATPQVTIWGSGKPLREFIYVDDLADALIFLMKHYNETDIINVGTGQEISIFDLATLIANIVGYAGEICLDNTKADGAPRKCLNSERLFQLGWQPKTSLNEGLRQMYHHHFCAPENLHQTLAS